MARDESRELRELISQGEHQQLDFKFEISDARKIARTFSAFSNTTGGSLLIGVKDNGRISGVRSEEEYFMAESAASIYCRPEIAFETRTLHHEGKTVLQIIIPEASEKPVYARDENKRWMAYIRVRDENFLASIVQLRVWQAGKLKSGSLLSYNRDEKLLLKHLEDHPTSSLTAIQKGCGFRRGELVDLLSKLIQFDVVEITSPEGKAVFSLVEQPGDNPN